MSLVLAGEVVLPVVVEVAVGDEGAEGEDGFGAVEAPSGASDVEAVGDDVPAGALDDAGGDGPASGEGLVVAEGAEAGGEVAGAGVGAGTAGCGQAGGVGFGGDLGCGPAAVAGQDRQGLGGDPVLGGGVACLVQGPGGLPDVLELSAV